MSEENHKLDDLLRRDVQRRLETFDWDQLNARFSGRLEQIECQRLSTRHQWFAMAAAAAILLAIVLGGAVWRWRARSQDHPSVLQQIMAGALDAGPLSSPMNRTDNLVASTDPGAILLAQHMHLVCSDPLLRPHSLWDQIPTSTGYTKERPQ